MLPLLRRCFDLLLAFLGMLQTILDARIKIVSGFSSFVNKTAMNIGIPRKSGY